MRIYIPTLGRAQAQRTYKELSPAGRKMCTLVIQEHEKDKYMFYNRDVDILILPPEIKTIAPTREYIIMNATDDKIIMMDDDLHFNRRREDHAYKLRRTTDKDIDDMLQDIERLLDTHAHVGISGREGNNRVLDDVAYNTRYMRILCYRTDVAKRMEHGRVEIMEDFDLNLQMLRAGYSSAVLYKYANGQGETNAPGGCSTFRTLELHNRNVAKLAELHPGFVKLKTNRKTKSGGELSERHEATIYWKKAYDSSKNLQSSPLLPSENAGTKTTDE